MSAAPIKSKKWIAMFFYLTFMVLLIISFIAYLIDPFFQYRVKDHTYFLTSQYVNAGLIKNYNYDALIVGSCMIGNFDMERFRQELNLHPLKAEGGGMGPSAIAAYLNYAARIQKANHYFVNIDLSTYQADGGGVINEYLMKDDLLARCKYFLGFETWFRYIPVDCALTLYKGLRGDFPSGKFEQRTSIDCNGSWNLDERFGEDIVIYNRAANLYAVSAVETEGLYDILIQNIDLFISQIDFHSGAFTFIFPPYSALYWCDAQDQGYCNTFLSAKAYFIQELLERDCAIYDFQAADWTMDLNNYKDSTHYSPEINGLMTDCFSSGDYLVTQENYSEFQEKLIENTNSFRSEYSELFE